MQDQFTRTQLLFGKAAMERLHTARVAVFGVGGVGGFTVEALARSGVGTLDLIDNDTVCLSNLNRQIIATHSTLGQYKVDAAAARVKEICPETVVHPYKTFFMPETADAFDFAQYDYVVDAIDSVKGKIELALRCKAAGVPLISSMGAGNKLDPTRFVVTDLYKTNVCPLAKVMRRELRKRGIDHLKVVYSEEPPMTPLEDADAAETPAPGSARRSIPGSNAFVPSVVGLIIAGEVLKDLTIVQRAAAAADQNERSCPDAP